MDDCPECGYWRSKGAKFCAGCGKDLNQKKSGGLRDVELIFGLLAASIIVAVIIVNTADCIMRFGDICNDCAGSRFGVIIPFGLDDLLLFTIPGSYTGILLALLLICEVACLAYALVRLFKKYNADKKTGDREQIAESGLCACGTFLSASLFLSVTFVLFALATGMPIDTSWTNTFTENQLIMLYTRAGPREELMYRIFWIGLPMMLLALVINRDRRCWQYLFGGFGLSKTAWAFILLSSALFGLGHLTGWGWGKILDAALGGLFFGYVYVKYGLYACILIHTVNDTIQCFNWIGLGQSLTSLATLSFLGFGLIICVIWVISFLEKSRTKTELATFPGKLDCGLLKMWGRH